MIFQTQIGKKFRKFREKWVKKAFFQSLTFFKVR